MLRLIEQRLDHPYISKMVFRNLLSKQLSIMIFLWESFIAKRIVNKRHLSISSLSSEECVRKYLVSLKPMIKGENWFHWERTKSVLVYRRSSVCSLY